MCSRTNSDVINVYDVNEHVINIEELVKSLNSYQQGEIILGLVVLDYWCVASPIILGDPTTSPTSSCIPEGYRIPSP